MVQANNETGIWRRAGIASGAVCLFAAILFSVTAKLVFAWLIAGSGFAFVVSALLYNAEIRPRQKHHMK